MKRGQFASGPGSDADLDVTRAAGSLADQFYREHGARVLAVCRGLLRDRGEAEDAAQQVFVSALRALLGGTEPRDPEAWLVTIARRECWARARNGSTVVADGALATSREDDALAAVIRREQVRATWSAIAGLPAAQRQAFVLREVRGLRYDELAADLRVSEASVRSLLSRARHTVRTCLERSAALIGASWLNALARLLGGGSNSGVAAAGKTAAVGLGALALGGGTLVAAPRLAPHPHASVKAAPPSSVGSGRTHAARAAAAVQVASVPSRPAATVVVLARGSDSGGDERRSARRAAGGRVDEGGRRAILTSRGDGGKSGGSGSSRDGGTSGDGSAGTTSAGSAGRTAGSSGGGPGPSSGGSSGSGDGTGSSDGSGSSGPSVTAAPPSGEGGSGDPGPSSGSSDGRDSGVVAFTGSSSGAGDGSSTDVDHGGSSGSGSGGDDGGVSGGGGSGHG